MKQVLRSLELGSSVAEFDKSLEKYFVENEAFHSLVQDRIDIVAGDKGTGKTALFRILQSRYRAIEALEGVEVLAAFNPAGSPIFQRLVHQAPMSEGQYMSLWKSYILSLVGNWILEICEESSPNLQRLSKILSDAGLRSKDDKPETIFNKLVTLIQKALPTPEAAEVMFTVSETGLPIVVPKIKFAQETTKSSDAAEHTEEVPHEQALRLLNDCLGEAGVFAWIALDRLDEAFQGAPAVEVPALRALLRTYLDTLAFDRIRLKLFVRRDLFKRIIGDGFVNLSHVNSRKIEITWDEEDLMNLLCRRVRDSSEFLERVEGQGVSDSDLFYKLFPEKVDPANRKPTTWNWIMSRIRDGNSVKPPRNLIDLVQLARDEQLKVEGRSARTFSAGVPIIEADALKKALDRLSAMRVEDTLLAEAGPRIAALVEKFRSAKAEHNRETLSMTLGAHGEELEIAIRQLVELGFLEIVGTSWKVPMLYRDGLDVTQGKAFSPDTDSEDDDS